MFTYYTIIGKNLGMIDAHLDNVCKYAGFNKIPKDKRELLVIVFRNPTTTKTNEIVKVIKSYGGRVEFYDEPNDNFLVNLYACWNLGYEHAQEGWVFRGGSDQVFSKDSMLYLYNLTLNVEPNEKIILQANTIENMHRAPDSRHILADLGDDFDSFNLQEFEKMYDDINKNVKKDLLTINDCLMLWGRPTRLVTSIGVVNRVDGCSWLCKKSDWVRHGPMEPLRRGITGDVTFIDDMTIHGYRSLLFPKSLVYHFVKGERRENE